MAFKKPSSQSSTMPVSNKPNDALYGNDGNSNTRSMTDIEATAAWWEVDMQSQVRIDRIKIYLWQPSLDMKRYGDIRITTRQSGQWHICVKIGVPQTVIYTVKCDDATTARYLRVFNYNGDYLALTDVEVYGSLVSR